MKEVFEKIVEKLEKKADELYKAYCIGFNSDDRAGYDAYVNAIEIVKQEAEEYNNGWISCSERLPDVTEGIEDDECPEFNVTIKGADKATTLKCASDGTWFDEFGNIYDVIAWQQLPAPYQPKEEMYG